MTSYGTFCLSPPSRDTSAQPRTMSSNPAPLMESASKSSDSVVPRKPWRFSQSPKGNGQSCPCPPPPARALCGLQACCQRPGIRCAWGYLLWCSCPTPPPPDALGLAQLPPSPTLQKLRDFSSQRCLTHSLPWPLAHAGPSVWNALTPCPHCLQSLILAEMSSHQGRFPGSLSAKMVPMVPCGSICV